jgi:hypothetical protein
MAKLSETRCPNCKAPIEFDREAASVQCRYCQTMIAISQEKAPRASTTTSSDASAPRPMVIYTGGAGAAIGRIVWIGLVIFLSSGGFAFARFRRAGCAPSESLPAHCGPMNDEVLIKGKTFDGPGPLVEAEMNCKITFEDCTLSSPDSIIKSDAMNVEVTVRNSKLTSKQSAIVLNMNGKVRIEKGSVVKSEESAVEGNSNTELTVSGSTLEGTLGANVGSNAKVTLQPGAILKGKRAALEGGSNMKLRAEGATLESSGPGLKAGPNTDVRMNAECKVVASPPFALSGASQMDVPANLSSKPPATVAGSAGKPAPAPLAPGKAVTPPQSALPKASAPVTPKPSASAVKTPARP